MLIITDEIIKRVAALMDDPSQADYDKDYLLPFINQKWDELNIRLQVLGLEFVEDVQVLANVPAMTLDLSSFMATGQPLQSFWKPASSGAVEWKFVGEPDTAYRTLMHPVDRLPDVSVDSQGILAWEYRQQNIYITPSSVPVDIRVRFEAMSTTLVDPTDQVYRGVLHILALSVAAMVWFIRGNDKMSVKLEQWAVAAQDDFEVLCVMADQGKVRRVQRISKNRQQRRFVAR